MEKKVYVELPPFTGRNVPITEIAAAMHKDAQYAVSYTHLDVYKRQPKERPIFLESPWVA